MNVEELYAALTRFDLALLRLEEAISSNPTDPLAIDGTIQRFEFTFELAWKTLQRFLEDSGFQASSPKESLRQGYRAGWIGEETLWLEMLQDRNLTNHTYREDIARAVFGRIGNYARLLRDLYGSLARQLGLDL